MTGEERLKALGWKRDYHNTGCIAYKKETGAERLEIAKDFGWAESYYDDESCALTIEEIKAIYEMAAAEEKEEKETRTARWKMAASLEDAKAVYYRCSACGQIVRIGKWCKDKVEDRYPWCVCGAKMTREKKEK